MRKALLSVALVLCTSYVAAAPPTTSAPPPSTMIFGTWTINGGAGETLSYMRSTGGTEVHAKPVVVPQDGAWVWGNATYSGGWMDCDHHYVGTLVPNATAYNPFFRAGYESGRDACFGRNCYSCSINWNGDKANPTPQTDMFAAFLPQTSAMVEVRSENGGGDFSSNPDSVQLWLAQVNVVDMESMNVREALANDDPSPIDVPERNSRAYIAASDDVVPVVATFIHGGREFPSSPTTTFAATWDTGDAATVEVKTLGPEPGLSVLLLNIPRMKSGFHTFTVTATLPSGKVYTASPYKVFVYNAALEAVVDGGTPITTSPVTFTRAQNVLVQVAQQDLHGRTFAIAQADWEFRTSSATITSTTETGFPTDSREWGGVMTQSGIVFAKITLKTGKFKRTSKKVLTMAFEAKARTGTAWETPRDLCEDCWTDLGIKNGGHLPTALVFPSVLNIRADAPFPANFGGGLALAMAGERESYEKGILSGPTTYALEPRTVVKPFPLYRPLNEQNDPAEWANRYSVSKILSGPNRGFWYVTQQKYSTEWAYALNAYFNPSSPEGSYAFFYKSWVLTGTPGCTSYVANEACYTTVPLSCWEPTHGALSYYQAAATAVDPTTGQPYRMAQLLTDVRWHEKTRHWQEGLVNFIAQNKQQFDLGTILEQIMSRDETEVSVRAAIDDYIFKLNLAYANHPAGGGYENYTDAQSHPRFPIVQDTPAGTPPTAPCTLFR